MWGKKLTRTWFCLTRLWVVLKKIRKNLRKRNVSIECSFEVTYQIKFTQTKFLKQNLAHFDSLIMSQKRRFSSTWEVASIFYTGVVAVEFSLFSFLFRRMGFSLEPSSKSSKPVSEKGAIVSQRPNQTPHSSDGLLYFPYLAIENHLSPSPTLQQLTLPQPSSP